jgi:hypothetical protein
MNPQDESATATDDPESIYRAPASNTSFEPKGDMLAAYVGPRNAEF